MEDEDYYGEDGEVLPTAELLAKFAGEEPPAWVYRVRDDPHQPRFLLKKRLDPKTVEEHYHEEASKGWEWQPHKELHWQNKFDQRRVNLWDDE